MSDQLRLQLFFEAQRLVQNYDLKFFPAETDWSFVRQPVGASNASQEIALPEANANFASQTLYISDGTPLEDRARKCATIGRYTIWRPLNEDGCPGEWLQNRADVRSTGTSSFRLNWLRAPQGDRQLALGSKEPMDPGRFVPNPDPTATAAAFVRQGTGIVAITETGAAVWTNATLGSGTIIDVADLDNDGAYEIIYSATAVVSSSAPGKLLVLSASTGELLWQHAFSGLEFGIDRARTVIATLNGAATKSLLVTQTYSALLMRFDFADGVRKGYLAWKSQAFSYDSPGKNSLVVDLDNDGDDEIIVDSAGVLYAIEAGTGAIISELKYADAPTFGGFLYARDFDGDGSLDILSASTSGYHKGYVLAGWTNGQFAIKRDVVWETGLENHKLSIAFLLRPDRMFDQGRRHLLLTWEAAEGSEIRAVDLMTGETSWTLPGRRVGYDLPSPDGLFLAIGAPSSAEILAVTAQGPKILQSYADSHWIGGKADSFTPQSQRYELAAGPALRRTSDGRLFLESVGGSEAVESRQLKVPTELSVTTLSVITIFRGQPAFTSQGAIFKATRDGDFVPIYGYQAESYAAVLVGDIDGDGKRSIVAPSGKGLSIVDGELQSANVIFDNVLPQQRESFHVPALVGGSNYRRRDIVAFVPSEDPVGRPISQLQSRTAQGLVKWTADLDFASGETSILVLPARNGHERVALRNNQSTSMFDGHSGGLLWKVIELGQCQRQLAGVHWDDDDEIDVSVQAGSYAIVYDGANAGVQSLEIAKSAYGGYSAVLIDRGGRQSVTLSGAGALAIARKGEPLKEFELNVRRTESLPVVIGFSEGQREEVIYRANGEGNLSTIDGDGAVLASNNLAHGIAAITGAHIDDDNTTDVLVSTSDGFLLAISGKDLKELWRVKIGAVPGPAITTTFDGITPAIVFMDSTGMLHVLTDENSV